ncbi:MAG: lytic transglycosylase domain-containing protein [Acidobacteria bacterium]|nr:MAG: lytic transglycosylase domain-containing protein [Acidobacteriota bacterium]
MRTRDLLLGVLAAPAFVLLPSVGLAPAEQRAVVAEAPAPEEILLLEELDAWSGRDPIADPQVPFPEHPRLTDAVQERQQSFELFCAPAGGSETVISSLPYGAEILEAASRHEVDPLLVASIVEAESSFDPRAVSPVGAVGLMQLMPETALELGAPDFRDPRINLDAGSRYLGQLLRRYDGNVALALAAYNAGPGNVERFGEVPPFRETQRYVERVLSRYLERRQIAWQLHAEDGNRGDTVQAAAGL